MSIDPEFLKLLMETFRLELEEQLQSITDELLKLEKSPDDVKRQEYLNSAFRAAHNIKGAARGVDANHVEALAHRLESLFSSLKQTNIQPSATIVDLCLETVDGVREAEASQRDNREENFDKAALLDRLQQAIQTLELEQQENPFSNDEIDNPTRDSEPVPAELALPKGENDDNSKVPPQSADLDEKCESIETESVATVTEKSAQESTSVPAASSSSDAIRVSVDKLQRVSSMAEEIQVAKIAIDDHFSDIQNMAFQIAKIESQLNRVKPVLGRNDSNVSVDASLMLAEGIESIEALRSTSNLLIKSMRNTNSRMGFLSNALQGDIRMLRLVPAATMLNPLSRVVRDIARDLNKNIRLVVEGDQIEMDRTVLDGIKNPLMHLIRNSVDHGIESPEQRLVFGKDEEGIVKIEVTSAGGQIKIVVSDDGKGIDVDKVVQIALSKNIVSQDELERMDQQAKMELIFRPGFSSKEIITDISGRGVGLDVVKANLRELNGTASISSELGKGASFILQVPLTLTSERGLQVRASGENLVIPSTSVDRIKILDFKDVLDVSANQVILINERPIPLRDLGATLEMPAGDWQDKEKIPVIIVSKGWSTVAFLVDEVVGEREIVIKRLQPPLISVPNVSGATMTGSGDIMMVLNVGDLVESAQHHSSHSNLNFERKDEKIIQPHILVVDDSITTRTLEKNILETHGYQVTTATDGLKGWNLVKENRFDLIVTDVEMPKMNGFELAEQIKSDDILKETPVIIVTSLAKDEDKKRGIEVGADAYIVKGQFETKALLDVVKQLL